MRISTILTTLLVATSLPAAAQDTTRRVDLAVANAYMATCRADEVILQGTWNDIEEVVRDDLERETTITVVGINKPVVICGDQKMIVISTRGAATVFVSLGATALLIPPEE